MTRLLVVLTLLVALLPAQNAKPTSYAEITGDSSPHQLASTGTCRSIQFIMPTANTAAVRIGDSTTSSTKGVPIAAGAGLFLPPLTLDTRGGADQRYYDLSALYYYAVTGDKVDFICFR